MGFEQKRTKETKGGKKRTWEPRNTPNTRKIGFADPETFPFANGGLPQPAETGREHGGESAKITKMLANPNRVG